MKLRSLINKDNLTTSVKEVGQVHRMFKAIEVDGAVSKLLIIYPSNHITAQPYSAFINWKNNAPEGEEREIDFADNFEHAKEIEQTLKRQSALPAGQANREYLKRNK